jgi:hypothetical protein
MASKFKFISIRNVDIYCECRPELNKRSLDKFAVTPVASAVSGDSSVSGLCAISDL